MRNALLIKLVKKISYNSEKNIYSLGNIVLSMLDTLSRSNISLSYPLWKVKMEPRVNI